MKFPDEEKTRKLWLIKKKKQNAPDIKYFLQITQSIFSITWSKLSPFNQYKGSSRSLIQYKQFTGNSYHKRNKGSSRSHMQHTQFTGKSYHKRNNSYILYVNLMKTATKVKKYRENNICFVLVHSICCYGGLKLFFNRTALTWSNQTKSSVQPNPVTLQK